MYQITGTESIKLLVETTQKLSVKITDEKGNVLNREALKSSGAMTINLSDVPSGFETPRIFASESIRKLGPELMISPTIRPSSTS